MCVNESRGGAVTLHLVGLWELWGAMRGYKGIDCLCVYTDIINLEGGLSSGRRCDSVTAGGALMLPGRKAEWGGEEERKDIECSEERRGGRGSDEGRKKWGMRKEKKGWEDGSSPAVKSWSKECIMCNFMPYCMMSHWDSVLWLAVLSHQILALYL